MIWPLSRILQLQTNVPSMLSFGLITCGLVAAYQFPAIAEQPGTGGTFMNHEVLSPSRIYTMTPEVHSLYT